ncbi:MAG TPA: PrsW family glutamic-type intramembrane protease [Spirochaetota bacterium]|nr:PrsW family glutamic-type intramembrane protease [Spirochaetota bacterium]
MSIIYFSIIISAAIWFYLIYRHDRLEPEPVFLVIMVGIAGGFFSSVPAAFLNTIAAWLTGAIDFLHHSANVQVSKEQYIYFTLFVGFNEEFWKAALSVLILKRLNEFNEPVDALIYSMTIALGFAAFENIEYTMAGGLATLVLRSITAMPLHIGLAAIWGSGIARAKYLKEGRYFTTLIPYVTVAALIHAAYNYLQFIRPEDPWMILVAIVFAFLLSRNAARRLKKYGKMSPFRKPGFCPDCGTENRLWASKCVHCGRSFMAK